MELKKGTSRLVFIGKNHVAKVPRPRDLGAIGSAYKKLLKYGDSREKRAMIYKVLECEATVGINANRLEAELYDEFPDLIVPIRFHLGKLGLINIQDRAEPFELEYLERHKAFVDELDRKVTAIGHTIEGYGNFGVHEGRIKIVDGGSEGLDEVLHADRDAVERALRTMEKKAGI